MHYSSDQSRTRLSCTSEKERKKKKRHRFGVCFIIMKIKLWVTVQACNNYVD